MARNRGLTFNHALKGLVVYNRLSKRPGAGQKAGVTNEPSTGRRWRRLWHPGWWLLALALAGCAWLGWRAYDERAAIREAQAAEWGWKRRDPVSLILADWRAAGQKETWTVRYRHVILPGGTNLAFARPLLDRLRPTALVAWRCPDPNLDALHGLSALQTLDLTGCTGLQNVDALRGLPALEVLYLNDCTALPESALRKLPAALPKTTIIFPDGTNALPP